MSQESKYKWYVRIIFWLQKRKYGEVLQSAKIWAKSPKVFLAVSCLYASLERKSSPINPHLRSLVIVRVSQLNGCSFCIDLNTYVLMQRGVSLQKIEALAEWRSSPHFSDQEKCVLEYTEAVTDSNKIISRELKASMKAHFSESELVELSALIAFQNMSTKFNNAFEVEPQGFCGFITKDKVS